MASFFADHPDGCRELPHCLTCPSHTPTEFTHNTLKITIVSDEMVLQYGDHIPVTSLKAIDWQGIVFEELKND